MSKKKTLEHDEALTRLNEEREALAADEQALVAAETNNDAQGIADVSRLIEARKRIIAKLEVEAAAGQEIEQAAAANAWLAQHATNVKRIGGQVDEAKAVVRERVAALIEAIEAEANLRRSVQSSVLAAEILARRFELAQKAVRVELPAFEDWSSPVMRAVDAMHPSRGTRNLLTVVQVNSDTPEQRRRSVLAALHTWLRRNIKSLPADVQKILSAAPIPDTVLRAPKVMSESEARESAQMAREVAQVMSLPAGVPLPAAY